MNRFPPLKVFQFLAVLMICNLSFIAAELSCSCAEESLSVSAAPLTINSGYIFKDGRPLFPLGFYELPQKDADLRAMAQSGVNLVRCHNRADLDRVEAVGMLAWLPVKLQLGNSSSLRKQVTAVLNHPALAVWEGPDEIVHSFTAWSGLYRTKKVYNSPDAWKKQSPEAVAYAEKQARRIIPKLLAGIRLVRDIDPYHRPIWFNEAAKSDLKFVRQYIDYIDIIGCDLYPVHENRRDVATIGDATERWQKVGRGEKPVWMVLQAFSWSELGDYYGEQSAAYPSFVESRFMAYNAIVHGAKGILYWGSHYLKSQAFRQSVYALTSELAALQSFLVAPDYPKAKVSVVQMRPNLEDRGIKMSVRKTASDWLIILVNEDNRAYMGVEVTGLDELNGRSFELLYGNEKIFINKGEMVTRLQPLQVKVFATNSKWETNRHDGRDFQ